MLLWSRVCCYEAGYVAARYVVVKQCMLVWGNVCCCERETPSAVEIHWVLAAQSFFILPLNAVPSTVPDNCTKSVRQTNKFFLCPSTSVPGIRRDIERMPNPVAISKLWISKWWTFLHDLRARNSHLLSPNRKKISNKNYVFVSCLIFYFNKKHTTKTTTVFRHTSYHS